MNATATKEKAPNYSEAQVNAIRAAAPLTFEKAEALAAQLGKTARSIIAKAKREGIEYMPKPPALKKPKGITKKDLVADISERLGLQDCDDLDKASTRTLNKILAALPPVVDQDDEEQEEIDGDEESEEYYDEEAVDDEAEY